MSTEVKNETENKVETTVETVDINIDEVFGAGVDNIMTPEEDAKPHILDRSNPEPDFTFTEKVEREDWMDEEGVVTPETVTKKTEAGIKKEGDDILNDMTSEEELEEGGEGGEAGAGEKQETRGRKPINGVVDILSKMVKNDKIFAFDDDKPLDEYTAKDIEDLLEANLEERANQVRRETPKQFFDALPNELKVAARYVADGGTDLKSLFKTLAQAEETFEIDPKTESGQEKIITEYLINTGFGTPEEINEEIEVWKDLGKLEQQAMKFKPKLDKMQEKVVAQKLQEQQLKQQQQAEASKQYMNNVYHTLKDGSLAGMRLDKKTQSLLYNGLVQPAYPSVSGKNTNLLGHLLEKYQFQEPNYTLISEALWLLADPNGFKNRIMEMGAQKNTEKVVRKLKMEQSNKGSASLGVAEKEKEAKPKRKTIPKPTNIFKRI
jgi:hypothetical protein